MSLPILEKWNNIINTGNVKHLDEIIHEKAKFFSPVVYTPQIGKEIVVKYLSTAVKVFKGKNFIYINKIIENNNIFAEFSATIDNIEINGIDLMRLENSLIIEFRVFIRPIKGLEKVWSQMRKNLN